MLSNASIDYPGTGIIIEPEDALRILRDTTSQEELECVARELNISELRAALILSVLEEHHVS